MQSRHALMIGHRSRTCLVRRDRRAGRRHVQERHRPMELVHRRQGRLRGERRRALDAGRRLHGAGHRNMALRSASRDLYRDLAKRLHRHADLVGGRLKLSGTSSSGAAVSGWRGGAPAATPTPAAPTKPPPKLVAPGQKGGWIPRRRSPAAKRPEALRGLVAARAAAPQPRAPHAPAATACAPARHHSPSVSHRCRSRDGTARRC